MNRPLKKNLFRLSQCFLLLLVISVQAFFPAHAAFDLPATLPNLSAQDLALNDVDNRISSGFRVPDEMKPLVSFWIKFYTDYTSEEVALFDSMRPEIVYDVLDFRPLSKTARNRVVFEILEKRRIKNKLAAYQRALLSLSKNPSPKKPTEEQQKILTALKGVSHPRFRTLARHLRQQAGQRDHIMRGLLDAEKFFPKMEPIFSRIGVPIELTRLALVESSFNLSAESRAGAVGVWQFMPSSAKEFLLVDKRRRLDERLSPLKSSVAAARLLKRNYRIFGSWPLAVTAYNHGVRGLPRFHGEAAPFSKVAALFVPEPKKHHLGWAGRNYYAEFLAVLYAESYCQLFYGIPPASGLKPILFHRLARRQSILTFAKKTGISIQALRALNPDIRNPYGVLPRDFLIAIPGENDSLAELVRAHHIHHPG